MRCGGAEEVVTYPHIARILAEQGIPLVHARMVLDIHGLPIVQQSEGKENRLSSPFLTGKGLASLGAQDEKTKRQEEELGKSTNHVGSYTKANG